MPVMAVYALCVVGGAMLANLLPERWLRPRKRMKKETVRFISIMEPPVVGLGVLMDLFRSGHLVKPSFAPMFAAAALGVELVRIRRSIQTRRDFTEPQKRA